MWKTVAVSVQGTSHLKGNIPCQDTSGFRVVSVKGASVTLLAIADGAGSAKFSDEGSAFVAKNWLEAAEDFLAEAEDINEKTLLEIADFVRSNIAEYVAGKEGSLSDYACTLLTAVLLEDRALFFQVGDGAWVHRSQGIYGCATWPFQGEFAGEVVFLTSKTAPDNYQTATILNPDAVAGFSDGLERLALKMATKEASPAFFESMFQHLRANPAAATEEQLKGFLNSERVNERTDDDKTLLLTVKVDDADGL